LLVTVFHFQIPFGSGRLIFRGTLGFRRHDETKGAPQRAPHPDAKADIAAGDRPDDRPESGTHGRENDDLPILAGEPVRFIFLHFVSFSDWLILNVKEP